MPVQYELSNNVFELKDSANASDALKELLKTANDLLRAAPNEIRREQIKKIVRLVFDEDSNAEKALEELNKDHLQEDTPSTTRDPKITLTLEGLDSVDKDGKGARDKISIIYEWSKEYEPSMDEMKLHQELLKAEDDIRRISRPQTEASFLFPIIDWLYPAQVDAGTRDFARLMQRLFNVAQICLGRSKVQLDQATGLIRDVLADATLSYGMKRRWEIAFRLGSALAAFIHEAADEGWRV